MKNAHRTPAVSSWGAVRIFLNYGRQMLARIDRYGKMVKRKAQEDNRPENFKSSKGLGSY